MNTCKPPEGTSSGNTFTQMTQVIKQFQEGTASLADLILAVQMTPLQRSVLLAVVNQPGPVTPSSSMFPLLRKSA